MSASSTPTRSPWSRRPSARLTATVDLPTPPLPDATAMMAPTPGTPTVPWARCAAAAAAGEVAPGRGRPAARSAVNATITEPTPGSALTAASARLRTGLGQRKPVRTQHSFETCQHLALRQCHEGSPNRRNDRRGQTPGEGTSHSKIGSGPVRSTECSPVDEGGVAAHQECDLRRRLEGRDSWKFGGDLAVAVAGRIFMAKVA